MEKCVKKTDYDVASSNDNFFLKALYLCMYVFRTFGVPFPVRRWSRSVSKNLSACLHVRQFSCNLISCVEKEIERTNRIASKCTIWKNSSRPWLFPSLAPRTSLTRVCLFKEPWEALIMFYSFFFFFFSTSPGIYHARWVSFSRGFPRLIDDSQSAELLFSNWM